MARPDSVLREVVADTAGARRHIPLRCAPGGTARSSMSGASLPAREADECTDERARFLVAPFAAGGRDLRAWSWRLPLHAGALIAAFHRAAAARRWLRRRRRTKQGRRKRGIQFPGDAFWHTLQSVERAANTSGPRRSIRFARPELERITRSSDTGARIATFRCAAPALARSSMRVASRPTTKGEGCTEARASLVASFAAGVPGNVGAGAPRQLTAGHATGSNQETC